MSFCRVLLPLCLIGFIYCGAAYAQEDTKILYGSVPGLSIEVLRHEIDPVVTYFEEKGVVLDIERASSLQDYFDWAEAKRFDINLVGPAMAYLLSKHYGYIPILETKANKEIVLVSHAKSRSAPLKTSKLIMEKWELLARHVADQFLPDHRREYYVNVESSLVALLKSPKSFALMELADIVLLPENLRTKLKWEKIKSYTPSIVMCRPDGQVSCQKIKNWLLELHASWKDPENKYTYMNSLVLRNCCKSSELIPSEEQQYIESIVDRDFGITLPNKN